MLPMALLSMLAVQVQAWGSSSNGNSEADESVYGNTFVRDWLYDSKSLSFKVEGCVWGYVEDSEEVGCLEDESEDGTTNWYMMANCRRPQVAFSVYASSGSSTSCNSNNFVESVSQSYEEPVLDTDRSVKAHAHALLFVCTVCNEERCL
jgi:hypothetical protein